MSFDDFARGYGSVLMLFPEAEKVIDFNIPTTSDEEALRKDWEMVGTDLYNAMESALNETQQSYNTSNTYGSKNHRS